MWRLRPMRRRLARNGKRAGKATLARWQTIQTNEVTRVNSLLEKAHLEGLKLGRKKMHP